VANGKWAFAPAKKNVLDGAEVVSAFSAISSARVFGSKPPIGVEFAVRNGR
jgi:hypothetical protein